MRTLAEELLLLALDDDKGTVSWQRSTALPFGLGGALLIDLALQQRIDSVDDKILLVDASPLGDEVLDAALETLGAERKRRDAKHWVRKLGGRKGLREQLARRLVERGILDEQEHTFLWVFSSSRFPTSDPDPEAALRERIRAVALEGAEPNERMLLLLSLVNACDLTDSLFSRDERKAAKRRIKDLVEGEQFGKAVGSAVSDAVMAATIAATTAATAAATTSSN